MSSRNSCQIAAASIVFVSGWRSWIREDRHNPAVVIKRTEERLHGVRGICEIVSRFAGGRKRVRGRCDQVLAKSIPCSCAIRRPELSHACFAENDGSGDMSLSRSICLRKAA